MSGELRVLEVRVLNNGWFFFFIFFLIYFLLGAQKNPLIQRGIVIEHNAIVYKDHDFDSEQIARIPQNTVIVISTKIYRPANLFGSFYKIYMNKPKKIRGYISEIDVISQYKRAKGKIILNETYKEREHVLKQVKMKKDPSLKLKESLEKEKTKDESTVQKERIKPKVTQSKEEEKKVVQPKEGQKEKSKKEVSKEEEKPKSQEKKESDLENDS